MADQGRLRIGVAQMTSIDNVEQNLAQLQSLLQQGQRERADLVVFPENALYMRLASGNPLVPLDLRGPENKKVQEWVDGATSSVLLTTATVDPSGKVVNATVLFQPQRESRIVYAKVHLFDVEVDGAPPVRESDYFSAGDREAVLELHGWRLGLSICYDLRFAELFSRYQHGVDTILVPSAFLVPTGKAHWEILLRARAIENQCFVVAAAQCGRHKSHLGPSERETYGNSLAIDPWGRIISQQPGGPGLQVVELERERIAFVRKQIPMQQHRRLKRL